MLGYPVTRAFFASQEHAWRPALPVSGCFLAAAVPCAALLAVSAGFDPLTAMLAATSARMQDIVILAEATAATPWR